METKKELIYEKMIAVMRDISPISKDRQNQQQGFKFRGIDQFMNECHGLFAKHGIFVIPEVLETRQVDRQSKSGGINICTSGTYRFCFYAEDGSHVCAVVPGEAMDSGDKGTSKSIAIALKYCLMQTFMVPTEDMKDPDAESPEGGKRQEAPKAQTSQVPPPRTDNGSGGPAGRQPASEKQIELIQNLLNEKGDKAPAGTKTSLLNKLTTGYTKTEASKTIEYLSSL